MNSKTIANLAITSLFITVFGACAAGSVDQEVAESPYREGFQLINNNPFTTQLPSGSLIDVWVTASAAAEYDKVMLDGSGSNVKLPEGTVIVREVLDDQGEVATLTLMIKNAPGYFPGGGDWWYGVADPDGMIRNDENGNPIMGALQECGGCHASRANDDFLFGIPSAYH